MSMTVLILFLIANLIFLFIGFYFGYLTFSPKSVEQKFKELHKPEVGVIPRRPIRQNVGQVEPISAEEIRKQNTPEGQEEAEMEKTFGRILDSEKKYKLK